ARVPTARRFRLSAALLTSCAWAPRSPRRRCTKALRDRAQGCNTSRPLGVPHSLGSLPPRLPGFAAGAPRYVHFEQINSRQSSMIMCSQHGRIPLFSDRLPTDKSTTESSANQLTLHHPLTGG